MTVINPSSISGITSITMPSGDGNVLTIHTNDGTERFRIDSSGNVKVGSACTISQDGDVFFTGVTTATTFTGAHSGSGANLTSLPAAQLTGALPAISGANLTGIAATDNVRTGILDVAGVSTFRNTMNVGAAVTISESGIEASGIGITVANINGTQIGGRRNIIINGAMNIAQRSTSASTTNGYATVDRFQVNFSGTDESPQQQQVDVASGTSPFGEGFRKALRITNGNQTSGAAAADYIRTLYYVEAQDMANSGWDYKDPNSSLTISFWVKVSVAQIYYWNFAVFDGTAKMYYFSQTLSANTWTKIIHTLPGHADLQYDNNNAAGMYIQFYQYRGTNNTGTVTAEQWNNYDTSILTPDQVTTWYTTNDATYEITGVQLEVGPQATPFEHRSYNEEIKLCERYFQTSFEKGQEPTYGVAKCVYNAGRPYSSSYVSGFGCDYRTEMRATPSVTFYTSDNGSSSTANNVSGFNGSSWNNYSANHHSSSSTKKLTFDGNWHSGITLYQFNYKADSEL